MSEHRTSKHATKGTIEEQRRREQEEKDRKAAERRAEADRLKTEAMRPPPMGEDEGWEEILIPVLIDVGKIEEGGGKHVGIYVGSREVTSDFGPVQIHYFMPVNGGTNDQPFGLWGCMALDQGLDNALRGRETRIDDLGVIELDAGKRLKKMRVRQRGPIFGSVPSLARIGAPKPAELTRGNETIDHSTGEVLSHDAAARLGL